MLTLPRCELQICIGRTSGLNLVRPPSTSPLFRPPQRKLLSLPERTPGGPYKRGFRMNLLEARTAQQRRRLSDMNPDRLDSPLKPRRVFHWTDANDGVPDKYFLECRIQPMRGATCDFCATCDFWTLKRNSCIKRYSSGVCPSPAGKPRRVFHCADAGHPKKRLGFFGPRRRGPKRKRFLAAASRTPKPQNQQRK
jgi:hypothetical protein